MSPRHSVPRGASASCFWLRLALRVLILAMTPQLDLQIVDEQHYHVLATSLVEGRGLARPRAARPRCARRSIRRWSPASGRSPAPEACRSCGPSRTLLGLATAVLVYWIARRLYDERAALVAAGITAFYPALVLANSLFLTETVFTFLLTAFVAALVALLQRPGRRSPWRPACCSAWPPSPAASSGPFRSCWCRCWRGSPRRRCRAGWRAVRLLLAGYAAVVAPWAVRNTRLQGVPVVVDTMGGHEPAHGQLRVHAARPHLGCGVAARRAELDRRASRRIRRAAESGRKGEKERWAREQALAFMRAAPGPDALAGGRSSSRISGRSTATSSPASSGGCITRQSWAAVVAAAAMTVGVPAGARPGHRRRLSEAAGRLAQPPAADPAGPVRHGAAQRRVRASAIPAAPDARCWRSTPAPRCRPGAWQRLREGWRVALLPVALARRAGGDLDRAVCRARLAAGAGSCSAGRLVIRAVLFDVDGTLYHQPPLRLLMAAELATTSWVRHAPWNVPRLWRMLSVFRHVREELRALGRADRAARPAAVHPGRRASGRAGRATWKGRSEEWIYERPLKYLPRVVRPGMAEVSVRPRRTRTAGGRVLGLPGRRQAGGHGIARRRLAGTGRHRRGDQRLQAASARVGGRVSALGAGAR